MAAIWPVLMELGVEHHGAWYWPQNASTMILPDKSQSGQAPRIGSMWWHGAHSDSCSWMPCLVKRSCLLQATAPWHRWISMMVQDLWCFRSQKPSTRPMIHYNEYLNVKLFGDTHTDTHTYRHTLSHMHILQFTTPLLQTILNGEIGKMEKWSIM